MLATTFPDLVGPVVAYRPSSVVWAGIDFTVRGARFGRSDRVRHLDFPEAGHVLFAVDPDAELKQPAVPFDLGGSDAAAARAHERAWPEVRRVLFN